MYALSPRGAIWPPTARVRPPPPSSSLHIDIDSHSSQAAPRTLAAHSVLTSSSVRFPLAISSVMRSISDSDKRPSSTYRFGQGRREGVVREAATDPVKNRKRLGTLSKINRSHAYA